MFQLVDIHYVCLVHFLLHNTPERMVNGFKFGELRGYKSVGMKSGVSAR